MIYCIYRSSLIVMMIVFGHIISTRNSKVRKEKTKWLLSLTVDDRPRRRRQQNTVRNGLKRTYDVSLPQKIDILMAFL